ncbi:type II toxin-antitoxin system VapC family toxin [Allokutzneria sp. A3M-2-11 16]|uniref:type II toxin-antitoxin system VapC family toxin n=1 Tax=Allokutzneria sp. A3M-2-11 16 TaxID=2962043 RepID=UPI0020B83A30|nr:type II toxin-antitoxin system VapC family toxin [Allokutzneria sp. A3M-2-11 16]MCP3797915.1 type II toxin-antitoxin system VapC family toxin [Allokutzneria sp. A3M-2-11 16]
MIYFDSSALVKLVRVEAETTALGAWLEQHPDAQKVTSALARVEVVRAVRDGGQQFMSQAAAVLVEIDQMPMTYDLLDEAATLPLQVKSLDAIHLASAMRLRSELKAFVCYDKQLIAAATEVGLSVAAPGAS